MAHLLVLNGPNLNLLGTREPGVYGTVTLAKIMAGLKTIAQAAGHTLADHQSNSESELVQQIQAAPAAQTRFILINPAAYTHTSVAIRDALLAVAIPFIEVHLSNVYAREEFRRHSYFSDIAAGTITGLGPVGYELALRAAIHKLSSAHQ